MFSSANGTTLPTVACNDQILTFDLNDSNNYFATVDLKKPYVAQCIKVLASQICRIKLDGVYLSNYVFDSSNTFPFVKSNEIMTATSNPIFYFIENQNSYISKISVQVSDPNQLVGSSLNLTIYFLNYIPSLICE